MQKLSWILNIILVLIIAIILYVFVIKGSVTPTEDGRSAIHITIDERTKILGDMRKFLEHVQAMVEAIGNEDMAKFSTAASGVGLIQEPALSAPLSAKLPLEFKAMGLETHKAFDELAALADSGASYQTLAGELSIIMSNCTYCHRSYRLEIDEE